MAENRTELLVGAAVLAVAAGFLVFANGSIGAVSNSASYEVTASFRSAEGITAGTDIRLAGVKVGSVRDLKLNPDTFRADARLAIDEGIAVPDDSSIVVASEGLLGGNFVEILPGGSMTNFENGAEVTDTQGAVSLIQLLSKFVGSAAQ
ncbi:MAG: outer membrane lipid asymmetry maintenance protein MlaD [Qingshengfaniella sp.]